MLRRALVIPWLATTACQLASITPGTVSCTVGGATCPDNLTCAAASPDAGFFCVVATSSSGSASTSGPGGSGASSGGTAGAGVSSGTATGTSGGATGTVAGTSAGGSSGAVGSSSGTTAGPTGSSGSSSGHATSGGASSGSSGGSSGTWCGAPVCVATLAGNGATGHVDGDGGMSGTTQLNQPNGIAVDAAGNVYVVEFGANDIRVITPAGDTTTLAGNRTAGFVDGTGGPNGTTEFDQPKGVCFSGGDVYVADWTNDRVRRVDGGGTTTTLAGNGSSMYANGSGGPDGGAGIDHPFGIVVDSLGANAYVCDEYDQHIRKIVLAGGATTTLAGNGTPGWQDGAAGSAEFNQPRGLAIDTAGNLYVADWGNNRIRLVAPDGTTSTLAGNGDAGWVDGTVGPSGTAEFNGPDGVALDASGNLYVADSLNNVIRKISLDAGTVTTLAGDGDAGFVDGVGGPTGPARFSLPTGVAVDSAGHIYVSDRSNNSIRVITQ